jgi:dGTPase
LAREAKRDPSRKRDAKAALDGATGRTAFRKDFQRLLHCPSFRRLQGKTQLFPSEEHDFYRTRLTHSLEVAQIAKSIAIRLNHTDPYFKKHNIDCDIIEFAGLAHDLGHPPFGHNGEYILDHLMRNDGGFEGNAQTLRILSRLEKKETDEDTPTRAFADGKDIRRGLDITARGLASVLKYDRAIPIAKKQRKPHEKNRPCKGYYRSEADLVSFIKNNVGPGHTGKFKTIECSIMDVADDIAYSTYDIEDAFAANFLNPVAILSVDDDTKQEIVRKIQVKINDEFDDLNPAQRQFSVDRMNIGLEHVFWSVIEIPDDFGPQPPVVAVGGDFFRRSELIAKSPYQRTDFTSDLIGFFINNVEVVRHKTDNPIFWEVRPSFENFLQIETLKEITSTQLIHSDKFLSERQRANYIITRIFNALKASGKDLMTSDWRAIYDHYKDDDPRQLKRTVCDFISGMTNSYCIEFYQRLFGTQPPSIHKPGY